MRLNLGCGEDYREGWVNVDVADSVDPDVVFDIAEGDWPWDDGEVDAIEALHVLEHLSPDALRRAMSEAARVLAPGRPLTARVPLGVNGLTDPDHRSHWTWDTPLHFTESGGGYQNPVSSLPFELADRRITDAIGHGPATPLGPPMRALFGIYRPQSPWPSGFPCMSFELEFTLKRTA